MTSTLIAGMTPAPTRPLSPTRRKAALWVPDTVGPYILPREASDRLTTALATSRNRDTAHTLAVFLGRFWTAPNKLLSAFAIDRRALAGHKELGLTENQIRGAIEKLEAIGFIVREPPPARTHQRTAEGLHRKPILFRFSACYASIFDRANSRAQAARKRQESQRRPIAPSTPARPSTPVLMRSETLPSQLLQSQLPQIEDPAKGRLYLGEIKLPQGQLQDSPLEVALARWQSAMGK